MVTLLPPRLTAFLQRRPLPVILAVALALRLALALTPRSYHADEIFQYLEQAHRLVFGYGVLPWEAHYGIRSMLLPVLLAAPMSLGEKLWPGSEAYLLLTRFTLCLVSLGSVLAAWHLGARLSKKHAIAAACAAAFWPEFALFASQALTDAIAVTLALAAAAILAHSRSRPRLVTAGALLAFAAATRFQYAPALLVLAAFTLQTRWRQWLWLTLGAAAALCLAAIPDIALGHTPYAWLLANIHQNIHAHVALAYGVEGPFFYPFELLATWAVWLFPLLWLAWLGARRYPALAAMVLANIAVHTAIAHKEYRFILLSTMTGILLAAIGTVDAITPRITSRWLLAGWALAAITSIALPEQTQEWSHAVPGNQAFQSLTKNPAVCGVAMWQTWWTSAGGYTYLHRPVPIYLPDRMPAPTASLTQHQAAFNVILAPSQPTVPVPTAYARTACFAKQLYGSSDACLYIRPGTCNTANASALEINNIVNEPDKPKP